MKEIYIGIDISQSKNNICIIENEKLPSLLEDEVPNSKQGCKTIISMIYALTRKYRDIKDIFIGVESTGIYSRHLLDFLSNNLRYTIVNIHLYCLNPASVRSYKIQKMQFSKNDYIDARACAEYICLYNTFVFEYANIGYKILKDLTSQRMSYTKEINRLQYKLYQAIFKRFSELAIKRSNSETSKKVFNSIAISSFLIEHPNINEFVYMSKEEMIKYFLREYGYAGKQAARKFAIIMYDSIRLSYKVDKASSDIYALSMAQIYVLTQIYLKQQAIIDKAIERIAKSIDDTPMKILMSIPGIGPVYAAGILSEIGDITLYSSNNALAKYAGLIWLEDQSGLKSKRKKICKVCNRKLRIFICLATKSIIVHSKYYNDYYKKKKAEVTVNAPKRAMLLTARKVVKLIYALLKDSRMFSANVMKRNVALNDGYMPDRIKKSKVEPIEFSIDDLIKLEEEDFKKFRESKKEIKKMEVKKLEDTIVNEKLNIKRLLTKTDPIELDEKLKNDKELDKTLNKLKEKEISLKVNIEERDKLLLDKYEDILLDDTREEDLMINQKDFDNDLNDEDIEEIDKMIDKKVKEYAKKIQHMKKK